MKKKILMIHHSGLLVGGSRSFYNTFLELSKKYDVEMYIPNNPSDFLDFLKSKNIQPNTFPFRMGKVTYYSGGNSVLQPRFWYHSLHILTQRKYWRKVLINENPDLVIVNSKVLCWMSNLTNELKIKSVCFVRETIPGNPENMMNSLMKKMLENFSLVVFISSYDLKQTNLVSAKTTILYNFLQISDYEDRVGKSEACKQLAIPQNSFNILFVGGINKLKGIDVALKAFKLLKNEKTTLIITGKDSGFTDNEDKKTYISTIKNKKNIEFSKKIHEYIEKEGLKEQIVNIGLQSDMRLVYSATDVLIFPMKKPHQARPAFEIGAQKKPVIISDFVNIKEFVTNEYNGLTFDPKCPKTLSDAIMRLKTDDELLKKLGKNNYHKTLNQHTKDSTMKRLVEEIDELFCEDL